MARRLLARLMVFIVVFAVLLALAELFGIIPHQGEPARAVLEGIHGAFGEFPEGAVSTGGPELPGDYRAILIGSAGSTASC